MPRDPKDVHPHQDALIIAHPESGELLPRDFETEGAVDLVAHRLHQLNALALFGAINQREMFYGYQKSVAAERYGDRAEEVLAGAAANRNDMEKEARDEYYRSLGAFTVMEAADEFPGFGLGQYLADVQLDWGKFQAEYRRAEHSYERNRAMRSLRAGIIIQQSVTNRQHEVRTYITKAAQKRDTKANGEAYELLPSRERLQALQVDSRAGFLPKNDREKIMCFTWLDYLDNPNYPLGITNQFIEIFIRRQRVYYEQREWERAGSVGKLTEAQNTARSVVYELYDHWHDALASIGDLVQLQEDLDGANPSLQLLDDITAEHPGLARLIRYRDAARYRDANVLPEGIKNPLSATEERWAKNGRPLPGGQPDEDHPDKNKTVGDKYTVNRSPEMTDYIIAESSQLTIRQTRKLLKAAIADEQARAAFLGDRMEDLTELPDGVGPRSLPMRDLARKLLNETTWELYAA